MIKLGSMTLFISWKCNLSCEHCGFYCSLDRPEKMSFQDALNYIDVVTKNPDLEMIAYSGGEPFLYLQEIKELMLYAYQKKIKAGLVTNAYWASDYQSTYAVLQDLQERGLQEIITSFDDFHMKGIPIKNITHLIKAATTLNIYTGLNILSTKKSLFHKSNASAYLGLDLLELEDQGKIWIKEASPVLTGRAKDYFKNDDLMTYGEDKLLYHPCRFVIRNSIITPDGSLYACCGFGEASAQGPANITFAGNIKEQGFEQLFAALSQNLMLNMIHVRGPYALLKMAKEANPRLNIRTRYVSNCDVCAEITNNLALRRTIAGILRELATPLSPK